MRLDNFAFRGGVNIGKCTDRGNVEIRMFVQDVHADHGLFIDEMSFQTTISLKPLEIRVWQNFLPRDASPIPEYGSKERSNTNNDRVARGNIMLF